MERVYDKYHSDMVQGDCYKYVHKCPKCGKILFEVSEYEFNLETYNKIPKFCSECGTQQRGDSEKGGIVK